MASSPEELVEEAEALGLHALALTDHDGFYGVARMAEVTEQYPELPLGVHCSDPVTDRTASYRRCRARDGWRPLVAPLCVKTRLAVEF